MSVSYEIWVAYAATVILFVQANKLTTAANAIFIQSTSPLYILLLGPSLLVGLGNAHHVADDLQGQGSSNVGHHVALTALGNGVHDGGGTRPHGVVQSGNALGCEPR